MFTAQVKEFLDAIAEGRKPRPSGEDGRVVMQVVEMAYASARESPGRS
jgi:predicted dehydrogenase